MNHSRRASNHPKSITRHGHLGRQLRAPARAGQASSRFTPSAARAQTAAEDSDKARSEGQEECTLDHEHDEHCMQNRNQKTPAESDASRTTDQQRQGSVKSPYSTDIPDDIPDSTKEIDSDGWHRTSNR